MRDFKKGERHFAFTRKAISLFFMKHGVSHLKHNLTKVKNKIALRAELNEMKLKPIYTEIKTKT